MQISQTVLQEERKRLLVGAREHLAAHHQHLGAIAQIDSLLAHLEKPEPPAPAPRTPEPTMDNPPPPPS